MNKRVVSLLQGVSAIKTYLIVQCCINVYQGTIQAFDHGVLQLRPIRNNSVAYKNALIVCTETEMGS